MRPRPSASRCIRRGHPSWASGDLPAPLVVGETEGEQTAQVEASDSVLQPGVVLGHAPVADASVPADQPGDAAFDHRALVAVGLLELWVLRPSTVASLQPFVRVEPHLAATCRGGALGPQWAALAGRA